MVRRREMQIKYLPRIRTRAISETQGKGEIRGFWLRQNDGQEQNQIPPLHCGMTKPKGNDRDSGCARMTSEIGGLLMDLRVMLNSVRVSKELMFLTALFLPLLSAQSW